MAPTNKVKKKRGIGRSRRRPTHTHAHLRNNNPGGRRGASNLQQEAIFGDAEASADVSVADAVSINVPVVVANLSSIESDSTCKAANTNELSSILNYLAPQESSSSPINPNALFPTNSQCILQHPTEHCRGVF